MVSTGIVTEAVVVQQRVRGVCSLGCGVVPVIDAIRAEVWMLMDGDSTGGVDALIWCLP